MKLPRFSLRDLFWLIGLLIAVGATLVILDGDSTTLISLSPDESWRVHLVERHRGMHIDRNFRVRLERMSDHSVLDVFGSPDEGRPIGSERILWSSDSKQFVLVGRHFYVNNWAELPSGEALYLLYDIPTGKINCNATQQSTHDGFTAADCAWLTK